MPNIMFVDDSASSLESLHWIFRGDAYNIFAFSNPAEALAAIEKTEFAAIVVDQNAAGDGIEFFRKVKAISPDTAGIIVYGFIEPRIARESLSEDGIFQSVKKPWDNGKIKRAVERAILQYEQKIESRKLGTRDGKAVMERREHKRFELKSGAIAAIRTVPEHLKASKDMGGVYVQMGPIMNISRGGLSFRYSDMDAESDETSKLDVSFIRNRFYLKYLINVPFETVWASPPSNESVFVDFQNTQRGVRFQDLAPRQISNLDRFLQTYAIKQA
ncbi:response regulator [Thermodesulfobacteriota bacterium]